MTHVNLTNKGKVFNILKKYVPDKVDEIIHVNPLDEMYIIVIRLLEDDIISLNSKSITLISKEWKTLLYQKFSILN